MSTFIGRLFGRKPASSSDDAANDRPDAQLKSFITQSPDAIYTFDGTSDARVTELCREQAGDSRRRDCVKIAMHSKRLFEAMQENGFFCALPVDPTRTNMECTPLPKS